MQTVVRDEQIVGLNGQLTGVGPVQIGSYVNNSKQLELVTVALAENATTYTVTINGTAFDFLSDGSATKAEISAGLHAAIAAGSEPVTSVDLTETLSVQANVAGTAFTIAVSDDGAGTDLTVANQIPNQEAIGFGKFVVKDVEAGADQKAHLPYAAAHITGNRALGFAKHDHANEQANPASDNVGYATQSSLPVLKQGQIYIEMEDAFTPASDVYIRYVVGAAGTVLGATRTDADTSKAALLPASRIRNSGSAGDLAIIDINLP